MNVRATFDRNPARPDRERRNREIEPDLNSPAPPAGPIGIRIRDQGAPGAPGPNLQGGRAHLGPTRFLQARPLT
jgi:hypothetical protein